MLGLLGILLGLALIMVLAFRSWTILLLAPLAAAVAALFSGQPMLAHWTQTFMPAAAGFVAQFFPLFLLGALFGKLMDDSGSVSAIADYMTRRLGPSRAILAVVAAGAMVTYGGVSLFVAFFVLAPMGQALFKAGSVPRRLLPAALALGTSTFTMSAMPGTPAIQNAIPMPYFGTTPFAAPGLGLIGGAVMLALGLLWLSRRAAAARAAGEGYGADDAAGGAPSGGAPARPPSGSGLGSAAAQMSVAAQTPVGAQASIALPAQVAALPGFAVSIAPIVAVVVVNYLASAIVLPRLDTGYLAEPRYGATGLDAVRGVWSIAIALSVSIALLLALAGRRLRAPIASIEAGATASLAPIFNTASLVGYGAVVASLQGFALIRDAVLGIAPGNPLVSLAIAVNVLAGFTGSASGGMSIALQALGADYLARAEAVGIAPALLHRVTAIATGGLDALPHNGAVVTLLAICGLGHRQSYGDIFVVAVLGPLVALVVVIALGTAFGTF